jgi:hemoglobin
MSSEKVPYSNIFQLVGGAEFFQRLVDTFYTKIEQDPILRPIFPKNLDDGRKWQFLFLQQFFGGPRDYEKIRGLPMLRKRHLPFPIGILERNRWVQLMIESLEELGITKNHPARASLQEYFETTATKMINKVQVVPDMLSAQKI